MTNLKQKARDSESVAMNIVHQLGDLLYEALPNKIAHEYFVDARKKTNHIAIEFTKKLIDQAVKEERGRAVKLLESKKILEVSVPGESARVLMWKQRHNNTLDEIIKELK